MTRFLFVSPRNNKEEVIECAVKLVEHNFNQLPDTNNGQDHLFIDVKKKEFWFVDQRALNHLKEVTEVLNKSEAIETNLKQIQQWQRKQKIKA